VTQNFVQTMAMLRDTTGVDLNAIVKRYAAVPQAEAPAAASTPAA